MDCLRKCHDTSYSVSGIRTIFFEIVSVKREIMDKKFIISLLVAAFWGCAFGLVITYLGSTMVEALTLQKIIREPIIGMEVGVVLGIVIALLARFCKEK